MKTQGYRHDALGDGSFLTKAFWILFFIALFYLLTRELGKYILENLFPVNMDLKSYWQQTMIYCITGTVVFIPLLLVLYALGVPEWFVKNF